MTIHLNGIIQSEVDAGNSRRAKRLARLLGYEDESVVARYVREAWPEVKGHFLGEASPPAATPEQPVQPEQPPSAQADSAVLQPRRGVSGMRLSGLRRPRTGAPILGERLPLLRAARGLRQKDLTDKIRELIGAHFAYSNLSCWEGGRGVTRNPDLITAVALALQVEPEVLTDPTVPIPTYEELVGLATPTPAIPPEPEPVPEIAPASQGTDDLKQLFLEAARVLGTADELRNQVELLTAENHALRDQVQEEQGRVSRLRDLLARAGRILREGENL